MTSAQIAPRLPSQQSRGASVALGLFDGVHVGHAAVIRQAVQAAGGELVPCVFTFELRETVPDSKNRYSELLTPRQKQARLYSLGVQQILSVPFEQVKNLTGQEFFEQILLERMHARILCCGDDFRFGRGAQCSVLQLRQLCENAGVRLMVLPKIQRDGGIVSSTRIRLAVRRGEMGLARDLLGVPFTLEFEVVHGRRLGRQLGAPTLNQRFPANFTVPRFGVYASIARIGDKAYPAVTNVGIKPTVGSAEVLAETHAVGFSGDLYGKLIPVELLEFLREERKFGNLEELTRQIRQDAQRAVELVGDWEGAPAAFRG